MTVSTTTTEATFTGSGTTGPFPFPWKIEDSDDLIVIQTLIEDGTEDVLQNGVDYEVTGVGLSAGGHVDTTDDVESTHKLMLKRRTPDVQEANLRSQATVSGEDVEVVADRLARVDQQLQEQVDRAIRFPETEARAAATRTVPPPTERRGMLLGFADTDEAEVSLYAQGGLGGGGDGVVGINGIEVTYDAGVYSVGLFSAFAASLSGGSTNEVGASVASVSLTWSFNKTITAQELAGTGTATPLLADRAQTVTGPFTTNTTFTITGHTATESDDASTIVAFYSKRYWGVSSLTTLTDAQIIALAGSELATDRTQTRSLSPSAQYIYFAWPTSFGTPSFTVNGLANTAWTKVRSASAFVNASGASVSYDLWRSDNLLTSTYSVGVA